MSTNQMAGLLLARKNPTLNGRQTERKAQKQSARDAERTREKILLHSMREFSARGFDGARVDRIALRTKLSKNTLYYHFGSKDGLITAVLDNMYRQLRSRQEEIPAISADPIRALKQIVTQTFRAFVENPEIIRLLNEENLHKARHIEKAKLREMYDPLVDKLASTLRSGAEKGVFQPGLDPVSVYIAMSSMAYHFISNSYTLQIALGRDLSSSEAYDAWETHINDVILTYCRNAPEPSRKLGRNRQ
jgi:TetR/AcrR family transcriptional regulator